MNRLEITADRPASRYHKFAPAPARLEALLLRLGVRTLRRRQREAILDFDATLDPLHGRQEGTFFHGYYAAIATCRFMRSSATPWFGRNCARPITTPAMARSPPWKKSCRRSAGVARRRGSSCAATAGSAGRRSWPGAKPTGWTTSSAWRNERLLTLLRPALDRAREQAVLVGGPARVFAEFSYRTRETWSRVRRVIGKAERLGDKDNPRFIVTSLSRRADELYEKVYCARGEMENKIKEQQGDLFGERLSSHGFAANQLRLGLSAFAYHLMERLRAVALTGTALAQATAGTIRSRLRKLAAWVEVSVRRLRVRLAESAPVQALFAHALAALVSSPGLTLWPAPPQNRSPCDARLAGAHPLAAKVQRNTPPPSFPPRLPPSWAPPPSAAQPQRSESRASFPSMKYAG